MVGKPYQTVLELSAQLMNIGAFKCFKTVKECWIYGLLKVLINWHQLKYHRAYVLLLTISPCNEKWIVYVNQHQWLNVDKITGHRHTNSEKYKKFFYFILQNYLQLISTCLQIWATLLNNKVYLISGILFNFSELLIYGIKRLVKHWQKCA